MIDFTKRLSVVPAEKKINPIEIYDSLDRESIAGPLRPAQQRVLEKWFNEKRTEKDLIVKLHTGAGKTLIGLLMALSCMNESHRPSLYVCPNVYLMKQACAEAKKFGIPFCFIGDSNEISNDFIEGKSILITYVQKVFNGRSIFGLGAHSMDVGCIILDDSHACIESMVAASTIKIKSSLNAYTQIVNIFEGDLRAQGEGTYQELISKQSNIVIPIPYWAWQKNIRQVTTIVSKDIDDNGVKYAWPLLKDQLDNCIAYVSAKHIEISPICMPINQFGIFSKAKHRILMSATTQEDTLFIKGLGLSIDAIKTPLIDDKYIWSGEKMILIPEAICENVESGRIIQHILNPEHKFGISVIVPSFGKAEKYVKSGAVLVNDTGNDVYKIIADFKENYKDKTIVLANRYDGIDLPDNTCRLLILDSVPYYDSLSDRYEELCRSDSEIVRIKTIQKIEQGLGRSVRGEKDYSVVLIMGSDLIRYIRSVTNRKLFSMQTQKQIEIGFQIVDMAKEDLTTGDPEKELKLLFSTINQCLNRDEGWKAYYSARMGELEIASNMKEGLYETLQKEKMAYEFLMSRNYEKAFELIQDIADHCDNDSEKGWYLQLAANYKNHVSQAEANKLQVAAFTKNNQLLKPMEGIVYRKIRYKIDVSRNQRILNEINKFENYSELNIYLDDVFGRLTYGIDAERFECAFYELGKLLGYESQRPDKEIRKGPDVLWAIGHNKYVLIECKSEVLETREYISKTEAGQMDEHCGWFESEYGSSEVLNILAIPTLKLASDAYFTRNVKLVRKNNLEKLKKQIKEFFKEFRKYDFSSIDVDFIHKNLVVHNLCDDYFLNMFLEEPIKD